MIDVRRLNTVPKTRLVAREFIERAGSTDLNKVPKTRLLAREFIERAGSTGRTER